MKTLLFILVAMAMPFSLDSLALTGSNCQYRPALDGDSTASFPVHGKQDNKTYSYLVKKDVMGDGTTIVLYPIYSKSWLLTDSQLREVVEKDHFNVIGGDVPEKITVIQNPKGADDFNSFQKIYVDPKTEKVCKNKDA